MKSKTKKIVILLLLGLVFPIILNNNFNFSVEQTTFNNLKTSAVYNGGIMIDGLATTNTTYSGNWTWAVSQPWCYDDNGVYIIEDLTINASTSPTGSGIYILDSDSEYFIIRNCTVYDAGSGAKNAGIKLEDTNNGTLTNNNCFNNPRYGIYLEDCNYNIISGNTANNNTIVGINLYFCYNNTVSGNTANYNQDAIYIEESDDNTVSGNTANGNSQFGMYSYFCFYNNITGNTLNNNEVSGIYLNDCDNNTITGNTVNYNQDAIWIATSDYNTLSGNTVSNNTQHGIFLYKSHYNLIVENNVNDNVNNGIRLYGDENGCDYNNITDNIVHNNDVGLYFEESCNYNNIIRNILYNNNFGIYFDDYRCNINLIYENFFLKNGKHADDDGTDNKWNSTTIGNYWDNHTGPDGNDDGIVDTQYNISGSGGSIDYLPIAEDGAPSITINSPDSGGVFYSTAPSFNVIITEDYLDEMWYTIDGGLNNYTFTDNGTIDQSAWDALSVGSITIIFYANDTLGHEASEDVIITKSVPSGEPDPTIVIVIVVVSIVGGIAVIAAAYLFLKKRKA